MVASDRFLILCAHFGFCVSVACASLPFAVTICPQGRTQAVEALLQVGADLSAVAARGTTSLHAASYYGHLDSVIIM